MTPTVYLSILGALSFLAKQNFQKQLEQTQFEDRVHDFIDKFSQLNKIGTKNFIYPNIL
jgi:hypothetical protein